MAGIRPTIAYGVEKPAGADATTARQATPVVPNAPPPRPPGGGPSGWTLEPAIPQEELNQ